jgi:hypothetical protein
MGPIARRLYQAIAEYRLDDRFPDELGPIRQLLEWDELPEDMAEVMLYQIQPEIEKQKRRPNLLHRAPRMEELYPNAPPEVSLGHLAERPAVPVGMFLNEPAHGIFAGTTKAGKTTAIRKLIIALEEHSRSSDRPVSVICLYRKSEFNDLPELLGPRWRHYDAHTSLALGMNSPAHTPTNAWINHISKLFCARAKLQMAWVNLANSIRWLMPLLNPHAREPLLWPDWQLLLDLARALPTFFGTKRDYHQSLVQKLEAITQSSGNLFRTFNGLDLERDVVSQGQCAAINIANYEPDWVRRYLMDLLVSHVLMGRIDRAQRTDRLEALFVIDEADDDVSEKVEENFDNVMSPIPKCLRMGREFGIGVCLGLGSMGLASRQILSAATYHYLFKMGDADSVSEARRTLLLPPGAHAILPALEPGECLVRMPGSWSHAMLGKIDYVPASQVTTPHYDECPHIPAKRLAEMPQLRQAISEARKQSGKDEVRIEVAQLADLHSKARELLFQASMHPYWPVARLYDLIGPPIPAERKTIQLELQTAEYATFEEERIGKKNLLLIELQEKAWRLLGSSPVPLVGRGGISHKTFSAWIAMIGEKRGYQVDREWIIPGTSHPSDACWLGDQKCRVFEVVVTATENLSGHLRAALVDGRESVSQLTIVAPRQAMLENIGRQLGSDPEVSGLLDQVDFVPVEIFEKELWP